MEETEQPFPQVDYNSRLAIYDQVHNNGSTTRIYIMRLKWLPVDVYDFDPNDRIAGSDYDIGRVVANTQQQTLYAGPLLGNDETSRVKWAKYDDVVKGKYLLRDYEYRSLKEIDTLNILPYPVDVL